MGAAFCASLWLVVVGLVALVVAVADDGEAQWFRIFMSFVGLGMMIAGIVTFVSG